MVRGRKPIATVIKEANGSFLKDPQRKNHSEPKPTEGCPEIPESIKSDSVALAWWNHTCELLSGMNLLTVADCDVIESYCMNESWMTRAAGMVAKYGLLLKSGQVVKSNPAAAEWNKCMDRRIRLQAELGLTASARTRLSVPPAEDPDNATSRFFKALEMKDN